MSGTALYGKGLAFLEGNHVCLMQLTENQQTRFLHVILALATTIHSILVKFQYHCIKQVLVWKIELLFLRI